jgi:uncharacterized protein (TIGR00255 family)
MIRSMTGFGEAAVETSFGRLRAEIRAVNHRFFSVNLRLARAVERWEPQVRDWLRAEMPRGHINVTVRLERNGEDGAAVPALEVDEARARMYVDALRSLRDRLGLAGDVDLALLTRFGDVLAPAEAAEIEVAERDVRDVVVGAARSAVRMREEEGQRLAADLEGRLAAMEAAMARIAARAPERLRVERDRMRRTIAELLEGLPLDEERIAREVAHLAERWDVSEELVRLRSHIELFREGLAATGGEPIGKRLGFLVQEMNRETNTIGSKANDAPMEHEVVAIKDEIERLREQVENVE